MNDNFSIIPHTTNPQVLLLNGESGWTLPQHQFDEAPDINRVIKEQLDLDVTMLRKVYDRYKDEDREDQHVVFAMENHSPNWHPPVNGRWVRPDALANLTLAVPEHREVLEAWFTEIESGDIPAERVPWAQVGWFDAVTFWIADQLQRLGYNQIGPIEQFHVRVWSCVLRLPTTRGNLYFKTAAPSFAFEPALTRALSELWPEHLPRVLAIDNERAWMLMEDAGTRFRETDGASDVTYWQALLDLFAKMQIESVTHLDYLQSLGCPDRRLNRLPALFEDLLADTEVMLIGKEGGLTEAEFRQLCASVPEVQKMCAELASYNVPETLHHDDFHDGNITVRANHYVFFDWAESALAHPFYTMIIVLRYTKLILNFDDFALIRLRDAYLQPWTIYEPWDRLIEAFELAQRVGLLCRALTWYHTVSHLEASARWEEEQSVPHSLRRFLYYPDSI